jgi:aminoglycoside phosphotransferase (APT) family kinase protein
LLDGRTGTAVVHSDLHAGQLPLVEGRLAALLDFGDAVAGPPAWDIGSFAYFHGWALTAHVLDAYTQDATKRPRIREEARHFAVVFALSHAASSVTRSQPARMEGALRYLRENLMA